MPRLLSPLSGLGGALLMLFPAVAPAATPSWLRTELGGGAFSVVDAKTHQPIPLGAERRQELPDVADMEANGADLTLRAKFTPVGDRVVVEGVVENRTGPDRGLIVAYRLPAWDGPLEFSTALDESHPIASKHPEENAYPIGAMSDGAKGIAVAIPPADPCAFGITADARGLVLQFYLGVSPATERFPNRAAFTFTVYGVDGREGFRSALSRYYSFYPDYYTPRLSRDGLWMFQMEDRVPPNVGQYGFDEAEPTGPHIQAAIERDRKYGIPLFPYTIVGQREIKFLPTMPADYNAAMQVLHAWRPGGTELSKEDVSADVASHLKDEIESSACTTSNGRYVMVLRNTPWGKNSITFKVNPSPYLFEGTGKATVGADALSVVRGWLRSHPDYAGVYVDSLGANWPATLDYRRDHFAYAHHALTIDPDGRVAFQNDVGHYEYLAALRELLRENGKLLFGNGVYAYQSRKKPVRKVEFQSFDNQLNEYTAAAAPPEHYHPGARLGRFFDAALLDVAGSEAGINASVSRCQDARVFMGHKPYAFLNYRWENQARVNEMVNKSLAYAIFATCSNDWIRHVEYEHNPAGYYRDKALWDWFVPLARTLSRAGWDPVRHARVSGNSLVCERYGSDGASDLYYAIYNDAKTKQDCTVEFDYAALGLPQGDVTVEEIGRGSQVSQDGPRVTFATAPKTAYVLRLRRTGAR